MGSSCSTLKLAIGEMAESCLPALSADRQEAGAESSTILHPMRYYIYFLKSAYDGGLYIGKTNNIDRRLKEHNSGQVSSTKPRRPLILLGYESFDTEFDARHAELEWKKGYRREILRKKYKL